MTTTRREALGLAVGAAAAFSGLGSAAMAQMAPAGGVKLGSPRKTMYWVATVTPCTRDGMFDPGAMAAVMQWHKSQGADGVVVLGTSGEFASFSVAERKTITETCSPSAPMRQECGIEQRRVLVSS